ncbi:MAG: serine hydrolase domain-containing protein [Armatimonadia bacterium]
MPARAGRKVSAPTAKRLREAIERQIEAGEIPGGVVLVGRGGEVLCHEAVGERMVAPERRPMEPDTLFDLASVTKPVATATVVMQLVEEGRLAVDGRVCEWVEGIDERVTLRHLLTHSSGLPAHKNYMMEWGDWPQLERPDMHDTAGGVQAPALQSEERRERVVADICGLPLQWAPGEGFAYSCLGFIVLTAVVERVTGERLDRLVEQRVTGPLGMKDTGFCRDEARRARCAATEQFPEGVLCGVVHDENARYLGGLSGNAGLFGTAGDLARFVALVMGGGELEGERVLAADTVAMMTTPQSRLVGGVRGLGWDIDSTYSAAPRGGFPMASFGHTGYTGTSIWGDRASGVFVVLLTNRVHFGREKDVRGLRREVGEIVAEIT